MKTNEERAREAMRGGRGIKKAQEMAEAFAKHRASDFAKAFLTDSGLAKTLFETYSGPKDLEAYTALIAKDYEMVLGQGLAIAYAVGFVDCYEGKSLSKLYVPQGTSESKD